MYKSLVEGAYHPERRVRLPMSEVAPTAVVSQYFDTSVVVTGSKMLVMSDSPAYPLWMTSVCTNPNFNIMDGKMTVRKSGGECVFNANNRAANSPIIDGVAVSMEAMYDRIPHGKRTCYIPPNSIAYMQFELSDAATAGAPKGIFEVTLGYTMTGERYTFKIQAVTGTFSHDAKRAVIYWMAGALPDETVGAENFVGKLLSTTRPMPYGMVDVEYIEYIPAATDTDPTITFTCRSVLGWSFADGKSSLPGQASSVPPRNLFLPAHAPLNRDVTNEHYRLSRLNAMTLSIQNQTSTLNVEGSIRAGRLMCERTEFFDPNPSNLNFVPLEDRYSDLSKYGLLAIKTIPTIGVMQESHDYLNDGFVCYGFKPPTYSQLIWLSDPDTTGATPSNFLIYAKYCVEFTTSAVFFDKRLCNATFEDVHKAANYLYTHKLYHRHGAKLIVQKEKQPQRKQQPQLPPPVPRRTRKQRRQERQKENKKSQPQKK